MKKRTRIHFRSIGAKIFMSMLALILLMLIFLWLSQTVLLSTFYELAKKLDDKRAKDKTAILKKDAELQAELNKK